MRHCNSTASWLLNVFLLALLLAGGLLTAAQAQSENALAARKTVDPSLHDELVFTWFGSQPNVRLQALSNLTVCVRMRNSSGSPLINEDAIVEVITNSLSKRGYTIVADMQQANYHLDIDTRYVGSSKYMPMDVLSMVASAGGALDSIMQPSGSKADSLLGLVGVMGSQIVKDRFSERTLALIIDVTIGQRIVGSVSTLVRYTERINLSETFNQQAEEAKLDREIGKGGLGLAAYGLNAAGAAAAGSFAKQNAGGVAQVDQRQPSVAVYRSSDLFGLAEETIADNSVNEGTRLVQLIQRDEDYGYYANRLFITMAEQHFNGGQIQQEIIVRIGRALAGVMP